MREEEEWRGRGKNNMCILRAFSVECLLIVREGKEGVRRGKRERKGK